MATIAERAKAHQEFCRDNGGRHNEYSYYLGATEQREMDIEKAIEVHCDICLDRDTHQVCKHPCEQLERIKKAMKGE